MALCSIYNVYYKYVADLKTTTYIKMLIFQLEQMELEAMDQGRDKQKYLTRMKSYKAELIKLEKDLVGLHSCLVLISRKNHWRCLILHYNRTPIKESYSSLRSRGLA